MGFFFHFFACWFKSVNYIHLTPRNIVWNFSNNFNISWESVFFPSSLKFLAVLVKLMNLSIVCYRPNPRTCVCQSWNRPIKNIRNHTPNWRVVDRLNEIYRLTSMKILVRQCKPFVLFLELLYQSLPSFRGISIIMRSRKKRVLDETRNILSFEKLSMP